MIVATMAVLAPLLLAAPPRMIQSAGDATANKMLATLDRDGDELIARNEWRGSGTSFLTLDADLDGYVSAAELARKGATPKREAAVDTTNPDNVAVAIRDLGEPIALFTQHCLACHDERRVEDSPKTAAGWAETVARMQKKKEAKIPDKAAKPIVAWLQSLRAPAAKALVGLGTADPIHAWGIVLGGGDLHEFDRDRNGKLDAAELGRLAFERVDFDQGGTLSRGEFMLLPLAADRRAEFDRLDRDKNGSLTVKELGLLTSLVAVADRNGDAMLARDELPRARAVGGPYTMLLAADAKTALEVLDRDRDGRLSAKELERFPGTLTRFDEDHDSSLEMKELETAVTAARAEGPYAAFDDFLTRYDLDGDGVVKRAEFPGSAAFLARLDVDGDGEIGPKDALGPVARTEFSSDALRWR